MRNKLRRPASIALSLSMLALVSAVSVPDVSAEDTWSKYDNTTLGTSGIHEPTVPASKDDYWCGNYVYYGKYNGNPVKYRVLDKDCVDFYDTDHTTLLNTLYLDCDTVLATGKFGSTNTNWGSNDCDLRLWMNGTFLNGNGNFTGIEKEAIPVVWKQYSASESIVQTNYYLIGLTHDEKIFPIDMKDIYDPVYGYSSEKSKTHIKSNTLWWLRTRVNNNNKNTHAATCNDEGGHSVKAVTETYGYSPAFNVLQDDIVFASKINPSNTDDYGNEYKLTLKDVKTELTVSSVSRSGNTVTVGYSINDKDSNDGISANAVSVLITGENGSIKTYMPLTGDFSAAGEGTFTLPADYTETDNVYILAEDINGQYETDYASEKESIDIPALYDVSIPECMEITNNVTLTDGKAAGGTVIEFRVKDGYTLTGDVLNGSTVLPSDANGIYTVTVNGDTAITAIAKMSVDDYKANGTYPTQTGKVFAGWYEDEAFTTPYESTAGEAYAKFVDENVLSVKVQAVADSQNSDKLILRVITSIEDLDRQNVSFIVVLDGNNAKEYKTRNAYTKLTTGLGHTEVTPTELSAESNYLCAINLRVNKDAGTFTITPKWTTADGTVVTGQPKTFNISA